MKFLHMADMHFDAPFLNLAEKEQFAQERRLEQRKVMREIVEYIKENNIPYFFIAGDLYEQEYIKKSTIEYINNLFAQIPNTKIFITPGNHDPYIYNSFYKQYRWNSNVHIFSNKLEVVKCEDVDIYGYGFNDFYMKNEYRKIEIKNPNKINILITHGNLDSGNDENRQYNPISSKELKELGFDYVALGHIHKASYNNYENQRIVYPGSTISLGFDELGARGVIVGEVDKANKEKININFLTIDSKTFEEKEVNIETIESFEALIELLNSQILDNNKFYKIILIGRKNFEINTYELLKIIQINNIIKIKDRTTIKYDINEISKQISLKGLFAKEILNKINNSEDEQQRAELIRAFEIGMDILNK